MHIPAYLIPLLLNLSDKGLKIVMEEGKQYFDALKNGKELTEEEKDKLYLIIDRAYRMERG